MSSCHDTILESTSDFEISLQNAAGHNQFVRRKPQNTSARGRNY